MKKRKFEWEHEKGRSKKKREDNSFSNLVIISNAKRYSKIKIS